MPTQPKKGQPSLPPMPPPAGKPAEIVVEAAAPPAADPTPEELRERAVEAIVATGLSREQAQAALALALAAEVVEAETPPAAEGAAVAEDHGQPICRQCFPGWAEVPAHLDGVGCEHGSWSRRPQE